MPQRTERTAARQYAACAMASLGSREGGEGGGVVAVVIGGGMERGAAAGSGGDARGGVALLSVGGHGGRRDAAPLEVASGAKIFY